jgi:hypothetical protein
MYLADNPLRLRWTACAARRIHVWCDVIWNRKSYGKVDLRWHRLHKHYCMLIRKHAGEITWTCSYVDLSIWFLPSHGIRLVICISRPSQFRPIGNIWSYPNAIYSIVCPSRCNVTDWNKQPATSGPFTVPITLVHPILLTPATIPEE